MSTTISISRQVPFSADRVFRELAALERHHTWMADAEAVEIVSAQRRGVGVEMIAHTRIGPLRTADRMVVVDWDEGRAIGVRHVGLVRGVGRLSVQADGPDRARVRWDEELVFPGGHLGELAAHAARPVLEWIWRGNLARLEAAIASAGPITLGAP